jgi:hypothetical protein
MYPIQIESMKIRLYFMMDKVQRTVAFKNHHGQRSPRQHIPNNKLRNNIQPNLNIRRCEDNSNRYYPNTGDYDTDNHCPPAEMGVPD